MFERVAAFEGDSTMIRVLVAEEDFDGDFAAGFFGFADEDFAEAFEVFDDEAFFFLAGVFFRDGDVESLIAFGSSESDSNTAFILLANTFFFASSVFDEAAFLTGEIVITPIYIF